MACFFLNYKGTTENTTMAKRNKLKLWWKIIKKTGAKFIEENPFQYSAAIAYFTIISLPGIAMLTVLIAGSFYEDQEVRTQLINQVNLLVGKSSAEQVEVMMEQDMYSTDSLFMKIFGIATLVFSAKTVFISLQNSMNSIWKIKPKPKREIVKFLLDRLLSLAMIISIGFLMLVSLTADTLIAVFQKFISDYLADYSYYLIWAINVALSLAMVTPIFAALFKVLPDAHIRWGNVWVGAIVTTLLFTAGKFLISFYLSTGNVGSAYGAASSLVALLAWVYFSVLLVIFGVQFTYVYTQQMGHEIKPTKGAVAISIEEKEREDEVVNK
jgi:membrane protein